MNIPGQIRPILDYETRSRKRILSRTIWVTTLACMVFSALNVGLNSWHSVTVIIVTAGVCLATLWISHKGLTTLASLLVCASVLFAITFSIYEGDGLLDPGILGYTLFVLLGTLLLDKRYTPWLTLSAIVCLTAVGILQANGQLHLTIHPDDARNLLPIIIFLITGSLIVWVILDNTQQNYARIRESEAELRNAYDLTIQGLSKALDLRDVDTGDHSHRVVALTEKLARATGYPEEDLLFLRYGAFLHDIGKLGIPDAILKKPGPLTAEEMEIMRSHPARAQDILAAIPYLAPALDIPSYHHEQWDGEGYPNHLAGTHIPLAARIFAIVDVYDALTHDRPYRAAWTKQQALAYIAGRAGTQFDPAFVQVFLTIMEQEPTHGTLNDT
jgi:hypothetical protein